MVSTATRVSVPICKLCKVDYMYMYVVSVVTIGDAFVLWRYVMCIHVACTNRTWFIRNMYKGWHMHIMPHTCNFVMILTHSVVIIYKDMMKHNYIKILKRKISYFTTNVGLHLSPCKICCIYLECSHICYVVHVNNKALQVNGLCS